MRVELRTLAVALAALLAAPVAAQVQSPSDMQRPAAKEMKSPSEMQEPAAARMGGPENVQTSAKDPRRMARAKARCRLEHGLDCDTPEGLKQWLLLDRSRQEAVSDGSHHLPAVQPAPATSRP